MRILMISPGCPFPPNNGGRIRTWGILRCLAAAGHEVSFVAFASPDEVDYASRELPQVCRNVDLIPLVLPSLTGSVNLGARIRALFGGLPYGVARFRKTGLRRRIERHLGQKRVDALWFETTYPMTSVPADSYVPVIVNNHNIEYLILNRYITRERNPMKRGYAQIESSRLKRWEEQAWLRSDLLLACSEQDRTVVAKRCPGHLTAVVPNAIDVEAYGPTPDPCTPTVVYAGGMDWHPNRDAVQFFVFQVMPELRRLVPNIRFVIAGRGPSAAFRRKFSEMPDVVFTGTVPDIRPELARGAVCVVPLRIGSGTRIKILEAAAMAKPIVSTRVGAEGLDFVDGNEILLADRPAEMARAVAALLADTAARRSLGMQALRKVRSCYSLDALKTSLQKALSSLAVAPQQ